MTMTTHTIITTMTIMIIATIMVILIMAQVLHAHMPLDYHKAE
jgi:hypothetical protein